MSSFNRDYNVITLVSCFFNLGLFASCVVGDSAIIVFAVGAIAVILQGARLMIYAAETSFTFNILGKRTDPSRLRGPGPSPSDFK